MESRQVGHGGVVVELVLRPVRQCDIGQVNAMSQPKFGRICNGVVMVVPSCGSVGNAGTYDPIDTEVVA